MRCQGGGPLRAVCDPGRDLQRAEDLPCILTAPFARLHTDHSWHSSWLQRRSAFRSRENKTSSLPCSQRAAPLCWMPASISGDLGAGEAPHKLLAWLGTLPQGGMGFLPALESLHKQARFCLVLSHPAASPSAKSPYFLVPRVPDHQCRTPGRWSHALVCPFPPCLLSTPP